MKKILKLIGRLGAIFIGVIIVFCVGTFILIYMNISSFNNQDNFIKYIESKVKLPMEYEVLSFFSVGGHPDGTRSITLEVKDDKLLQNYLNSLDGLKPGNNFKNEKITFFTHQPCLDHSQETKTKILADICTKKVIESDFFYKIIYFKEGEHNIYMLVFKNPNILWVMDWSI